MLNQPFKTLTAGSTSSSSRKSTMGNTTFDKQTATLTSKSAHPTEVLDGTLAIKSFS